MTQQIKRMFPAHEKLRKIISGEDTQNLQVEGDANLYKEFNQLLAMCDDLASAARTYFEGYMQDEADDIEHCICGEEQHEAAKSVKQAIAKYNQMKGESNGQ